MLASQPCAECLAKLAALCDDTAAAELELVQEYLVFPAQLHLKTRAAGTPRNFTFKDLLTSCLALLAPGAGEDLQLSLCFTLISCWRLPGAPWRRRWRTRTTG